jgi:hypothetical protein
VKLYGERNSGTQFLQSLISANTDARVLRGVMPRWAARLTRVLPGREWVPDLYFGVTRPWNLGWKHGPLDVAAVRAGRRRPLTIVTLRKNPYSWLLSLYRRPYHTRSPAREGSFLEFVQAPWPTVRRDRHRSPFRSPVDMWNFKIRSYVDVAPGVTVVRLRYEDLLADPHKAIIQIGEAGHMGVQSEFRNLIASTKEETMDFERYRAFYLEETWREQLDGPAISAINQRLEEDLVVRAGYELM